MDYPSYYGTRSNLSPWQASDYPYIPHASTNEEISDGTMEHGDFSDSQRNSPWYYLATSSPPHKPNYTESIHHINKGDSSIRISMDNPNSAAFYSRMLSSQYGAQEGQATSGTPPTPGSGTDGTQVPSINEGPELPIDDGARQQVFLQGLDSQLDPFGQGTSSHKPSEFG